MKTNILCLLTAAAIFAGPVVRAEDKPEGKGSREELREKLKNMTPEERQAKIKELREKSGGGASNPDGQSRPGNSGRPDPEQMKKMATDIGLDAETLRAMSPEERRKAFREAAEKKFTELNKKKEDGTITDSEKELLKKMEEQRERMKRMREEHEKKPDAKKDEKK